MNLTEIKNGTSAYVVSVNASKAQQRRMMDLGFIKGEKITRLYASPLGSPIVYSIMGQNVSLRKQEALSVEISEQPSDAEELKSSKGEKFEEEETTLTQELNGCKTTCSSCKSGSCLSCSKKSEEVKGDITLALVGNPNCGKTAFFNAASGGHERTGNYAGVTVTSTVGHLNMDGKVINIIDLPGTYSLHSTSPDEAFVMHEIAKGKADVILNIVDVNNLERNLLLTMQLLRLGKPVVCVLNMYDEFKENGNTLNIEELQKRLGITCVTSIAKTGEGVKEAIKKSLEFKDSTNENLKPKILDSYDTQKVYEYIKNILKGIYSRNETKNNNISKQIDKFTAQGPLAYIVFALTMIAVFYLTFEIGAYPMDWIDSGVEFISESLSSYLEDGWFKDLIIDGIIGGVGSVIVFLPNILILYFCISLLEDSGYLARAAMLADPLLERMGLHGKSFIPMLMGFGCNVPAVMATRTIENRKTRLITMLAIPFMSCSARLPVYVVLCGAFFPENATLVMSLLYFFGIFISLLFSWIMNKFYKGNIKDLLIMEIPKYRMPQAMSVISHTWEKGRQYLHKMGGVILVSSVIIWALGYFPQGEEELTPSQQQEQSYLGRIGHAIEPVFSPMGFDWRMDIGILTGTGAKELMVSTLGVLYDCPEEELNPENSEEASGTRLSKILRQSHSKASAIAYMIFALFYFPCIATVVAISSESGRKRMAIYTAVYTTSIAYIMALLTFYICQIFIV